MQKEGKGWGEGVGGGRFHVTLYNVLKPGQGHPKWEVFEQSHPSYNCDGTSESFKVTYTYIYIYLFLKKQLNVK